MKDETSVLGSGVPCAGQRTGFAGPDGCRHTVRFQHHDSIPWIRQIDDTALLCWCLPSRMVVTPVKAQ